MLHLSRRVDCASILSLLPKRRVLCWNTFSGTENKKYLESRLAYDNAPKGAGAKKRQKKPRRGQNNVEQLLILSKEDANEVYDPDLDVPKYCRFTGVYHTDEPFHIIFV